MVCFGQSVYKITNGELETFYQNAQRYYPGYNNWKVSHEDVTIKGVHSDNLKEAVARLNSADNTCVITFDTGRIWDQMSFVCAIPKVENWDNIIITEDDRKQLLSVAEQIVYGYHDSGTEVAIQMDMKFPWQRRNQVLKLVHELMPLHGFFVTQSSVILRKEKSWHLMEIFKQTQKDDNTGKEECMDIYTNCVSHIMFDFDDGFIYSSVFGGEEMKVCKEYSDAFDSWKLNKKNGPVLQCQL